MEVDRLRKGDAAKEMERRQRDAARTTKGAQGEKAAVVEWVGGVVQ